VTKAPAKKRALERRAHARFDRTVDIHPPEEHAGTLARMVSRNLSLGGLQCVSPDPIPEMTRLAVRLMIPDGAPGNGPEPLDVEAVVVRSQALPSAAREARYELGLFFTSMSDGARERLARFLAAS
jgi:c-di-GMP-binding flagellar brake protein YcgR